MKKKVTILIPCYNEQESLPHLYEELCKLMDECSQYDWELLFINDGSKDNTLGVLDYLYQSDNRVAYIDLSRNFGKENAMLAGFDMATGDAMVIMDADLQHPPHTVVEMLKYWEEGYDDVYAKRRDRNYESWPKRKISNLFYYILDKSTRYDVLRNVGDFRLLDRKCINALKTLRESERYTKGLFCWIGFRKKEILFDVAERQYGKSSWNLGALIHLAIEGMTSFTTAPLKIGVIVGLVVALLAILYMLWVVINALLWGDPVAGYPTIMTVMLFLGAVQLICTGILGEYIGKIYNETKSRPTYLMRTHKTHNSNQNSDPDSNLNSN